MVTYVVFQVRAKTPLTAQQASGIVAAALQGPGPAVIHFHTGLVKPNVDEQPGDSRYRLLEKAGIVKSAKAARGAEMISLTPAGERLMSRLPGFKTWKEPNGTLLLSGSPGATAIGEHHRYHDERSEQCHRRIQVEMAA